MLGLMVLTQYPRERNPTRCYHEAVEQVRLAQEVGFDSIFVGEHHFTEDIYPDNFSLLSTFAAETDDLAIRTSVWLLPLHHPGFVAERAATLDAQTGGRFMLGAGAGYRTTGFELLGVSQAECGGRLDESLELIPKLWTEDRVSFEGTHYSLTDAPTNLEPVQNPHPPIWLGGSSPPAIRRAAKAADAWLCDPLSSIETLNELSEHYDRALEDPPTSQPLRRDIHVTDTTSVAMERARPHILEKIEPLQAWSDDSLLDNEKSADAETRFREFADGRYLIGSPDEAVADLTHLHSELGVNHVIARVQWPSMPHEQATDAIRLLGEEVAPQIKDL